MSGERESMDTLRQRADLDGRFSRVLSGYNPQQVADYMNEQKRILRRQAQAAREEREQLLEQIAQLGSEIDAKNIALAELKRQKEPDLTPAYPDLRGELREQDRKLAALQNALRERDASLAAQKQALSERELALSALKRQLADRQSAMHEQELTLAALEAELSAFQTEAAYCRQIRGMMSTLSGAAVRVRETLSENERLRTALDEQSAQAAEARKEVETLRRELAAYRQPQVVPFRIPEARATQKPPQSVPEADQFDDVCAQLRGLLDQLSDEHTPPPAVRRR